MDRIISELGVIAAGIIGLATIAVLVSRGAQTPQVIQSASRGFADVIGSAVSPVTGGGSYSYPSTGGFTGGF